MATGFRRARQAAGTDASTTIAWCNGCYMIGNMFRIVYPVAPRVTHLVEAIQEASGEQPVRRMPRRAFDLLLAASEATARGLVSKATT